MAANPQPTGFKSKQVVGDELSVCFSLHRSFQLPQVYETADVVTVERCLQLGADSYAAVRSVEEEVGAAAATAGAQSRAVKAAEEKAAKVAWKLEQEVERLRQERAEVAEEAAKLRAEFAGLQASFQEKLEVARGSAAADASRRVVELESKLCGLQDALRYMKEAEEERVVRLLEREGARRAELVEAKEAVIAVLKEEKKRREEELATAQEALMVRRGAKANSAVKGQLGEEEFAEMAGAMGWGLERTAKESRSCDYRGEVGGMAVFFEVKAHERRVPSADVDKFKRDMNEHPEVGAGVFVALHAPMTRGGSGTGVGGAGFWTEFTGDGRLLVFVSELLVAGEETARLHLGAVARLLEVAVRINKARLAGDGDQLAGYKMRVEAAEKYILAVKERARETFNTLHNDKRNLLSALQTSYERLAFMIRGLQTDVQMTLGALLGEAVKFEEDEGIAGTGSAPAAGKEVLIDEAGVVVESVEKPKKKTSSRKSGSNKV
jgi:hypothetical protein